MLAGSLLLQPYCYKFDNQKYLQLGKTWSFSIFGVNNIPGWRKKIIHQRFTLCNLENFKFLLSSKMSRQKRKLQNIKTKQLSLSLAQIFTYYTDSKPG